MTPPQRRRSMVLRTVAFIALAFGLLTLKEGGTVLFGSAAARAEAGNYVPFVLWFNFLAGFAYIVAGVGMWLQRSWAARLAVAIAAATVVTFAAFGLHIQSGGAFEPRTVGAMSLRTVVWVVISIIAWRMLVRPGATEN